MDERQLTVLLAIGLLVIGTVPATVLGQSVPRNVLLDEDTRQMATVSVDGQTYEVYRIENVVWFASGIDIYANGDRIRSEQTARRVLEKLARRRAAKQLGPAKRRAAERTERNVSEAAAEMATAARAINDTLAHFQTLKENETNGSTAYNATVQAAPAVESVNESASAIRGELAAFQADATAFEENASTLVRLLEQRQNGTTVDHQRLFDRYVATVEAKEELDRHLGYDGLDERLNQLSKVSRQAAANVSSVPETDNRTAAHLHRLANTSGHAANATAAIELPGYDFERAQDTADSLESQWFDRWQSRQNAGTDVYYTLAGLALLLIGGAGYARYR